MAFMLFLEVWLLELLRWQWTFTSKSFSITKHFAKTILNSALAICFFQKLIQTNQNNGPSILYLWFIPPRIKMSVIPCLNLLVKNLVDKISERLDSYSPSPVIESRKKFWVQRKFLFHVLIWPYDFQKNFGANRQMVN